MTADELADALIVACAIREGVELRTGTQRQCRVLSRAVLHLFDVLQARPEKTIRLALSEAEAARMREKQP